MEAIQLFFLLPVVSLAICIPIFSLYRLYIRENEFRKEAIRLREERIERHHKLNSLLEKKKRRKETLRKRKL